jgi:hypothetical protein
VFDLLQDLPGEGGNAPADDYREISEEDMAKLERRLTK